MRLSIIKMEVHFLRPLKLKIKIPLPYGQLSQQKF